MNKEIKTDGCRFLFKNSIFDAVSFNFPLNPYKNREKVKTSRGKFGG